MKSVTKWAPPVAVSLLFHVVLLVLVTQSLSANKFENSQVQTIAVELMGKTEAIENKHVSRKSNSTAIALPTQESDEPEQLTVASSPPELQTPAASPQQTNQNKQQLVYESETVQPISKVTRAPSFLRKIEPVYPRTEQRAGSEANVLAEVTIDSKGKVLDQKIIKSAGVYFDNAVIDALKESIFSPALIDKQPVAARVLVPYRFNLH